MPKIIKPCLDPAEVDPSPVYYALESVAKFSGDCDDWVTIKVEIMQRLNPFYRRFFSTRDPKTKEQSMNDFEISLAERFRDLTGRTLILRTREQRRKIYGKI
jgi:hypothetical protein